jgi:hypothetical protein
MKSMKQLYKVFFAGASALFLSLPALASAHEVYVLTPAEITKDTTEPAFPFMDVVMSDMHHFVFWGFITALVIVLVFLISISRKLENIFDPFFMRMRKYAPLICRVTVGIAFLAAAYNSAAYGPELPLVNTWGMYTIVVRGVLVCLGILTIFGVWVRAAAIVALGLYAVNVYFHGFYMLTYTNYLGEVLILLLVGTHEKSVGRAKGFVARTTKFFEPYSFLILRVCFGVSLFYASFYAKFLHNNLALDVASGNGFLASIPMHAHTVAYYLGFEPHFLVLGAYLWYRDSLYLPFP